MCILNPTADPGRARYRLASVPLPGMRYLSAGMRHMGVLVCACLLFACASQTPQPPTGSAGAAPDPATERYTVALLGATGMVGGYLLREALARGHEVRALARNPAKLDEFRDQITIIAGDARDSRVIESLLLGSDVVVSALGPVKSDGDAARFVNTTVTANVIREAQRSGISRYMLVSGAAVVMPSDERNLLGWWIRTLARLGLRSALQDKQAEFELLAESQLDWMLVRCPLIDPEPFSRAALVSLSTPPAFRLRAGELARFMIDQIGTAAYSRQGPFLGSQ